MKKSMLVAGLFQFVVALVLAAPAVAQQSHYTIQVPFPFHVDARVLPAGEYSVGIAARGAVQIHGMDHNANATFGAPRVNGSSHGLQDEGLVFHRYGQQYFLSQVWFGGGDQGYALAVSRTEREYARQITSADTVLRAAK
jgi:hypothetical protein